MQQPATLGHLFFRCNYSAEIVQLTFVHRHVHQLQVLVVQQRRQETVGLVQFRGIVLQFGVVKTTITKIHSEMRKM